MININKIKSIIEKNILFLKEYHRITNSNEIIKLIRNNYDALEELYDILEELNKKLDDDYKNVQEKTASLLITLSDINNKK